MIPFHMRASRIVIGHPFGQDEIQVPLTEQNELRQAFEFDTLNDPFSAAIQIG